MNLNKSYILFAEMFIEFCLCVKVNRVSCGSGEALCEGIKYSRGY